MIVVDASLFVAWLLNEADAGPDHAVWDTLIDRTIVVPAHWPNEIANALRRAVRTHRLARDEIEPIVTRANVFDIELAEPTSSVDIGGLAIEALDQGLSTYDMTYIRLAREKKLPLATIDRAMRAAAQRLRVDLLPE